MTQPHSIPMASHAADAQSMRHTANVLFEFVPQLFCQFGTFWGPIRHTLTQCWPNSSHTYFWSNNVTPTCHILFPFIANRIFCRSILCTGAFLLFAPLWARSSSSSTRPSSRPRIQSAGRRTTTSGMHTASSTYQIRVSSISTTLGERGVSFLVFLYSGGEVCVCATNLESPELDTYEPEL